MYQNSRSAFPHQIEKALINYWSAGEIFIERALWNPNEKEIIFSPNAPTVEMEQFLSPLEDIIDSTFLPNVLPNVNGEEISRIRTCSDNQNNDFITLYSKRHLAVYHPVFTDYSQEIHGLVEGIKNSRFHQLHLNTQYDSLNNGKKEGGKEKNCQETLLFI